MLNDVNICCLLKYLEASSIEQCCMKRGVSTGCMDLCRKRTSSNARSSFPSNTRCEKHKAIINMCWNEGMVKILSASSKWITRLKIISDDCSAVDWLNYFFYSNWNSITAWAVLHGIWCIDRMYGSLQKKSKPQSHIDFSQW